MSIDITVGIFMDRVMDEEESSEFYAAYDSEFQAINHFLRSRGLPEHHEPGPTSGLSPLYLTATGEMYPFKDIAWMIESKTSLRFPHLLELSGEDAIYLPLFFEEVLEIPDGRPLGSSLKLYEECRLLSLLLGIYNDMEHEPGRFEELPDIQQYAHELDKKERQLPLAELREQMKLWYPSLTENVWSVKGTGSCLNLYEAAVYAIRCKAALVIH